MNSLELLHFLRRCAKKLCRSFRLKGYKGLIQIEGIDHLGQWDPETGKVGLRLVSLNGELMSLKESIDTLCHELAHADMDSGLHNRKFEHLKRAMIVWIERHI